MDDLLGIEREDVFGDAECLFQGGPFGMAEQFMQTQSEVRMANEIQWGHDLDAALQQAKTEQKFVFLDVFNPG